MPNRIKWCLVKLPDDLGVFHVGGKTGARFGPESFEICFNKFRGKFDASSALDRVLTLDDRSRNGRIRDHLDAASALVADAHSAGADGAKSVVVGGGHDFGYAQLLGLRRAFPDRTLGCVNLDAHFDLRKPAPEITSGSPYYLALEEKLVDGPNLIEFGIQDQCNEPELWDHAEANGVRVIRLAEARGDSGRAGDDDGGAASAPASVCERFGRALDELAARVDAIALSLDLDCVAEAYAPGVSAPVSEGFTPDEVFAIARRAAREPKVVSVGIFELNPLYDRDRQTARLAAKFARLFLEGALR